MELDTKVWARQQWGSSQLGDRRLTGRAILVGQRMAEHAGKSLQGQMDSWAETIGASRLLSNEQVKAEELWRPHLEATRAGAAREAGVVLFIQDWTTLDYTAHQTKKGIGPVGSRQQRGMLLHSALAVVPAGKRVLGVAHLQVFIRPEEPRKPERGRSSGPEGQAWEAGVKAVGRAPEGAHWLHVSDRESAVYAYMAACVGYGKGFVVRAFRNRKVRAGVRQKEGARLKDLAHTLLPKSGSRHAYTVTTQATKREPARQADIVLSWCRLVVPPPEGEHGELLDVWVVRAWETDPPPGATRVEWILLTSECIETATAAARVVEWYTCRWLIEDYHMCLKTGCRIEHSQLDDGADLQRLLGFAVPIAVRLLQLRQDVRNAPEVTAKSVVDPLFVQLLAARLKLSRNMSLDQFWKGVAQLGGHLGRKSDGPPGWRTLWQGWIKLSEYALGACLLAC